MKPMILVVLFLITAVAACTNSPTGVAFPTGEIVDLSHTYDSQTIYWPTAEGFQLRHDAAGVTPAGYYYAANSFFTSEHGGTHIDAPVHFAEGHQTVDKIPLDRLIGPAVVIDVTQASDREADYQVTTADFQRFEQEHGAVPMDAIVLLRTGFSTRWPGAERYLGTTLRGDEGARSLHFPGLHPDAARWIVANRKIRAIGIDTASIDYGPSTLFESHRELYAHDIPAFENLTSLDRLPVTGAYVIALPMKIGGGSGAPLRAVAILPQRRVGALDVMRLSITDRVMPVANPYAEDLGDRAPLEALADTAGRIRKLAEPWSDDDFEKSYAPGKWSARQILVHLAQTELALSTRARFALTQAGYTAQPFSQDDWMSIDGDTGARTALDAYTSLRRLNVAMWKRLTPDQLGRPFSHPEYGDLTVGWVMAQMAGHDIHHLKQLQQIA